MGLLGERQTRETAVRVHSNEHNGPGRCDGLFAPRGHTAHTLRLETPWEGEVLAAGIPRKMT